MTFIKIYDKIEIFIKYRKGNQTVRENEKLKQNLRTLRKTKGLSQKEAACAFGISVSSYQKYELTGSVTPSLPILIRIADYYNVPIDDLLGRNIKPEQTLLDSIANNLHEISPQSKKEINEALTRTFEHWSNKQKGDPAK